jgi:hypothetical protein
MVNFEENNKPDAVSIDENSDKSSDNSKIGKEEPEERKGFTSTDSAYLEKLEFRPELRKTWLNFFVTRFRVVSLLIILISVWGLYSFFKLPRESNPEVKIPIAVITDVYPGASPADV